MTKKIFMIAGPNGAGKTTTAISLVPALLHVDDFINADDIARGLTPLHPESVSLEASKLMIKRFRVLLAANKNFAFESTAAGINYLKHLKLAKEKGYEFTLIFLWLANPDLAVERVSQRVARGGHHIPEEVIRRRYKAGLKNMIYHYLPIADRALIMDNSKVDAQILVARKEVRHGFKIEQEKIWQDIQRMANE